LCFLYFLEFDYKNAKKYADKAVNSDHYNARALVNKVCVCVCERERERGRERETERDREREREREREFLRVCHTSLFALFVLIIIIIIFLLIELLT